MSRLLLRRFCIVALAIVQGVASTPVAAPAEDLPPALRHDIGGYALFGRSEVVWSGAASMPLRGATGSESLVDFAAATSADGDESFVAAPDVTVAADSHLHFVFANSFAAEAGVVVDHDVAALDGPVIAGPHFPQAPVVECGGEDIVVDLTSSPLTLPPGRYGDVTVQKDAVLSLEAGGRYEMCSLQLRPGASVEAHTGTFVLLRDYLLTGARARIGGTGACGARWIALATTSSPAPASAGFEFSQGTGASNRALIQGQFFTPGRITMAQHNDYVGRFWADRIQGFASSPISRTLSDCSAPYCGDGSVDPGEECDDGNNLDGDCCSAFCEAVAEGGACDDGLFCTTGDACDANGFCIGSGDPCEAPDGDANCSESCNEASDDCSAADPDASPCDDAVYCNGADRCASGQCIVHAGSPCPGPDGDGDCRESCDEGTRSCSAPDGAGAPCDDGRFCTVGESCNADGSCDGGAPACPTGDGDGDCSESCDELADSCTAIDPEGAACDDGLFCTADDRCDGHGVCIGYGNPCPPASGDADADCSESCDEGADSCSAADLDGSPCDDGLACTVDERCLDGVCAAGALTSCDDGNPCTDEFCTAEGNCLRGYNSAPCDDGNPCTTGDRCIRGECSATGVVDCQDDDLCSSDSCDPADGSCHHSYAPADGCHDLGRSRTQIELGYSKSDGEPAPRLTTLWRGAVDQDVTSRSELGDPADGDAFAVCFYDESAGLPELAYRIDLDASTLEGAPWKTVSRASGLSYRLKAPAGTSQGVSYVRLAVDRNGMPTLKIKAGANAGCPADCRAKFHPPSPAADGRLFAMDPATTVQWVSAGGACWSARYEDASTNSPSAFRARRTPGSR